MASFVIKANGVTLPAPVAVRSSNETIWSENTGRSSSGKMVGTIVAQKGTFDVEWGVLTTGEMKTIKDSTAGEFFTLEITEYGSTTSMTVYRSALSKELLGYAGGVLYYLRANTSFIQQ